MWNARRKSRSRRKRSPAPVSKYRTLHHDVAEVEFIGSTVVATLTVTELSQTHGIDRLADLMHDLADSGARKIVLDIQNVEIMDSACLAWLVKSLNWLAARGGRIALANAVHQVQQVFKISRLDRMFPVCSNVMAAMAAVESTDGRSREGHPRPGKPRRAVAR